MITKKIRLGGEGEAVLLLGEQDAHLRRIESENDVEIFVRHEPEGRGLHLTIRGAAGRVQKAYKRLSERLDDIRAGRPNADAQMPASAVQFSPEAESPEDAVLVTAYGKVIRPKSPRQWEYCKAIMQGDMAFGIGPAGTGKTYLAVACALRALKTREISRIVLTRPVVEAGEKLGFLPGDLYEKVHPYLKPLFDSFFDMLGPDKFRLWRNDELIEVVPLAYMRGRTLENAFIILDEAQNTSIEQMKMFLTRMGNGSRVVVTGDVTQVDLTQARSGLILIEEILKGVKGVSFIRFNEEDVVRHPLVKQIIRAFDHWEKKRPS
ncbi:MAG: PhoH family protein [Elusimicrobia bacterium]|nr:PhoH family protein [Elusimicrobiota bacterium]